MIFYNEFDPHQAAKLRAYCEAGLIIFSALILLADSAFYLSARGTLDKEPKPFRATCSFWNSAKPHFFPAQACEQYQEHEARRTTHKLLVPFDCADEILLDCFLEAAFVSFSFGKARSYLDYEDGILEHISPHAPAYNRRSKATSGFDPDQSEMFFRRSCIDAQLFLDAATGFVLQSTYQNRNDASWIAERKKTRTKHIEYFAFIISSMPAIIRVNK